MSSPSWRSLLGGFLGWTRATGEKVPERRQQQLPFTDQSVPLAVASNPNLHAFTFVELSAATRGFTSGNKIGEGRFGTVCRGSLEDGVRPGLPAQAVAVKRGLVDDYVQELLVRTSQTLISFSCARIRGRPVS
jgi:hypothetical protein